jgi:hypothetical protein
MNRRRLSLLIAVVLVASTFFGILSTPKAAKANDNDYCWPSDTFSGTFFGNPDPGHYDYVVYVYPNGQAVHVTSDITTVSANSYHIESSVWVTGCSTTFHDGRINNRDAGQTVAIYCTGGETGGVFTLIPASPVWKLGLVATAAEINAVKPNPNHPVLIKRKGHIKLFRLQDGSLQINAPGLNPKKEDYNYIFSNCGV